MFGLQHSIFDTALSLYLSFYLLEISRSSVFQDIAVDQISRNLTFEFYY